MCGIAGELNWLGLTNQPALVAMAAAIAHRGPDDAGLWRQADGRCALAHRRLSIIDLSPLGHQPMVDPETGNVIVFNGEIYNYRERRQECEGAGDTFRSHSDTEVILALYRRHGVACLDRLRGMFAFALWDEGEQRLFLARDRVGKKPLNYALTDQGLVFCSEIDALARHPAVCREEDPEALELYLQLQYIPAPWTIYRHIRKLPPAHYALINRNGFTLKKYWEVDYRQKVRISEADALDGLEEKLTEAVKLRMISDVPLGALLSGGVDSSVIVALMAKLSGEPIRTFSMGFREEAFNELPFAQQAADICQTRHRPEILEGNIEHLLPQIARHYGEPYADTSAVPSFMVCQSAQRQVTVVMNGDGGDELLGGYPRYWLPDRVLRIASLFGRWTSPALLVEWVPCLLTAHTLRERLVRKLLMNINPESRSLIMCSGFWDDPLRAKLLTGKTDLLPGWRLEWLEAAFAHADNPVERMLWYENHTYLPGDLLAKMDIASMHCGLETRSPLLDHVVIEYCARLPVSAKVKGGVGKYLLKKMAERYFPADFVYRPKMGFGIPLADWLKGPLRSALNDVLGDEHLMRPLALPVIKSILLAFDAGDKSQQLRLWSLLNYGVWNSLK